jgi:hypothetical protein
MIVLPIIIPSELKNKILTFVKVNENSFIANGHQRKYCNLNNTETDLKYEIQKFAEYCYGLYNINVKTEPMFGNFIGVNLEGGSVYPHKDPRSKDNEIHVRINFLVSKSITGGMPILDGIEYKINEGDCWVNLASEMVHQSTVVEGDKPRVVLSLGSFVSPDLLNNLGR